MRRELDIGYFLLILSNIVFCSRGTYEGFNSLLDIIHYRQIVLCLTVICRLRKTTRKDEFSIINTHKMQLFLRTKNTRDLKANGRVLSEIKLKDTKRLDLH